MIRAVLFDLDDTLVDHQHANRCAVTGVRERFVALQGVALDDLLAENTRLLDDLHRSVAVGTLSVDAARIERYRRLFRYAGAAADADRDEGPPAAAVAHRTLYHANRRRVPGALELLQALAGRVRIGVVTNNTLAEQTEKLARFDLAPLVEVLVTSEEVGVAKPDPRIFAVALERVECAADEAVMVGDSLANDVHGARSAGLAAVWLNRAGAPLPAGLQVPVLDSLEPAHETVQTILAA